MSKKGKYSAQDEKSFFDNAIDTLVANIRFAAVDTDIQTICITSSVPNEGKTTISIGLAQALANQGRRVLVVENDLHRRSLGTMLGVHARYGLYSVLMGQSTLEEAAVATKTNNLFFLDCEPHIPNPSNVLSSRRYRSFLARAEQAYDFIVFDTPPVSAFVDGAIVAALADATLLVVRQDFTKRDEVVASLEQLRKADANVIGTVLNFVARESSHYYYYSYYTKDGQKVPGGHGDVPKVQAGAPAAGGAAAVQAPAASAAVQAPQPVRTQGASARVQAPARSAAAPAQPVAAAPQSQARAVSADDTAQFSAAATRQAQASASGAGAAQTARKPAPDSTEQFMIDAGYFKNTQSKS